MGPLQPNANDNVSCVIRAVKLLIKGVKNDAQTVVPISTELKTSGTTHYRNSFNLFRFSNGTFLGIMRNILKTDTAFRCLVKSDSTLRESLQGSVICHTLTNKPDAWLAKLGCILDTRSTIVLFH